MGNNNINNNNITLTKITFPRLKIFIEKKKENFQRDKIMGMREIQ